MLPKTAALRIVVLKSDLLYGDLICQQIKEIWRNAVVQVFQRGLDALEAIQAVMPDLFITGVKIEDMDGLEHLEPFMTRDLPILILTSRTDARTFSLLRTIRYDGLYDGLAEGLGNLRKAMERVMEKEPYVSPTFVQHLKKPKNNKRDILTEREQMILSVIGDGTDNQEAGEKLALSTHTIHSHRKAIMGKLRLHHRGQLIIYALQQGYIQVSPSGVYRPGFQRKIRGNTGEAKSGEASACA